MAGSQSRKPSGPFSQSKYETLAEFRYHLVRFLRRRKDAARAEGLQAQQYELLLAGSGLPKEKRPTIKEIATQLCLEHHTVLSRIVRFSFSQLRDEAAALIQSLRRILEKQARS